MELYSFIREAMKYDNMVLFVPDAIDELRIKENGEGFEYTPELLDGWPLPFQEKWLCERLPPKLQQVNPLNPQNFDFSTAEKDIKSAISSTLKALTIKITDQINSRDRTLVEQSKDGVLVFRPYWAASVPSGVEQEMIYNSDLKEQYGESGRKAYMLTTCEDLGKWRIKQLFTLIENSANINAKDAEKLQALCQKWLDEPKRVLEFYDSKYNIGTLRKEIESVLPGDYEFSERLVGTFTGALAGAKMLQKAELRDRGWDEIFKQLAVDDPLSRYTSEDNILISYREKFEKEAENFVRDVVIGKTVVSNEAKGE